VAHSKVAPPTDKEPHPRFSSSKHSRMILVAPQGAGMPED